MATAGDGRAPYESAGAGGKFRKRPSRRSAPATPYDRPPTALRNNNRGLFTKLVDPASRLIYAGAHKLFGVFRTRLPPLSLRGPPEINEEPKNISKETGQNNSTGVSKLNTNQDGNSSATGISDLEQMLKQKSFTRSEIEHLTALLHSRTNEPSSDNNPAKRIEASTSGSLKIYEKSHTAIATPVISSRVLEEKTSSPADLAKAYMASKPTKLPPSPLGLIQDSNMINNTTTLQTTLSKNGFLTPRSRGRSAMYSMARTPYTKSPLIFNQKEIMSSSESLKRRSSVLDDNFGSGGPLRRTRQKPTPLLNSKRELGYTAFQESMLLRNEPEENQSTINPSVPTKSTETATKIFQQLEKLSPKKSPTKLTSNMLHGQALRSLEKVELPKFVDTSKDVKNLEGRKFDSEVKSKNKGKEKVEENGEWKFAVPFNMLTTVNGDVGVSIKEKVEIVKITKNDQFKVSNGNDQKLETRFGKSESLSPVSVPGTSTSGIFSFASSAKTSSSPTITPDSSPSLFSSSTPPFPPSDGNANSLFSNNNTSSNFTPASTTTTPVFSFGSIKPTTSVPETVNSDNNNNNTINETEPKPIINTTTTPSGGGVFGFSSPATTSTTTTTTTGGALFGFSSPAATSTTTPGGGGALFGFSAPATTSTTTTAAAATTSGGGLFGFSSPATTSTTTTTAGGALFGFSAPATTTTSTATPQSTTVPFQFGSGPTPTTSLFGSSTPTFGTTATSSEGKSGNSVFGSSWPQNPPVFSFGASPTTTTSPITFGTSTASSTFSFTSGPTNPFGTPTPIFNNNNNNNNNQMSMEDSMAEDSMQTPSPTPVSPLGQPGFMFGQPPAVQPQAGPSAFQFGGQPSLPVPPQNPFQSSSLEFNAGGGSFSLGSTGGEKSGRRIVRINKSKNRRK